MSAVSPARRRILAPPATVSEMLAQIDALGFSRRWFQENVPPLTPSQVRAELDRVAPLPTASPAPANIPECSITNVTSNPAKQTHRDSPALQRVPQCSTPYRNPISAKQTHRLAPTPSKPSDPENVPHCSAEHIDTFSAEPSHRSPPAFQSIAPSPHLTPRQERAARLLAAGHTATAAAALLGVERHTIHRYKRLPAFNDHLRRLLASL